MHPDYIPVDGLKGCCPATHQSQPFYPFDSPTLFDLCYTSFQEKWKTNYRFHRDSRISFGLNIFHYKLTLYHICRAEAKRYGQKPMAYQDLLLDRASVGFCLLYFKNETGFNSLWLFINMVSLLMMEKSKKKVYIHNYIPQDSITITSSPTTHK